jgi:hypothetical protein
VGVKGLRVVALMLVTALVGGPTLLDRCLISCHDDPGASVPTCHEHADLQSPAVSIHGVEACGHDHDGLPADTLTDSRTGKTRGLVSMEPVTVQGVEPPRPIALAHQHFDQFLTLSAQPVTIPLRV